MSTKNLKTYGILDSNVVLENMSPSIVNPFSNTDLNLLTSGGFWVYIFKKLGSLL